MSKGEAAESITVEQPFRGLFLMGPLFLDLLVPKWFLTATFQLSSGCGGRLPFLRQMEVAWGIAFYANPDAPWYQRARDLRPDSLLCEEPQTGIDELSSERCLVDSRGGCLLCAKKPLAPLPPTAEAVPDLGTIPINGCSCHDPSPDPAPPVPSCCCHRNWWRGTGKGGDDNKNCGVFKESSV